MSNMSFSDLSQISDLHSISRISRVNCSRIMGRIDSLQNLSEYHSITQNTSRNTQCILQNQGFNHLQKAIKRLTLLEESIQNHVKSKIILECIKEAAMNEKKILSKDIVKKLTGLLLMHEIDKYMHLPSASIKAQEKMTLLGITDLPECDLTYEEKLDVKCYVEALLCEKTHDFVLSYEELGGNMKEVTRSNDNNTRKKLFQPYEVELYQWKDKIEELCEQYKADIARCKTLMDSWNNLKYIKLNRIYLEKAEYMLMQAEVAEVQAKITKLSCIMRMFKETPITVTAYKTLNSILDEKLSAKMNEINQKENLKRQYDSLQSVEYSSILKTYLELNKAIQKKKQILEKL
ncbi:uncharacterized protein LOC143210018 [Lasioglossum baleicum]|uniref:uncharacterized protein LOC143210018 n=1 Tax=Lasioglossum baleicum TaxID=434251 RepID=UPI003FCD6DB7